MNTIQKLKAIFKDDSGQGMLEYVLILAIILVIAGLFRDKIKGAIAGLTEKTGGDIQGFNAGGGGN